LAPFIVCRPVTTLRADSAESTATAAPNQSAPCLDKPPVSSVTPKPAPLLCPCLLVPVFDAGSVAILAQHGVSAAGDHARLPHGRNANTRTTGPMQTKAVPFMAAAVVATYLHARRRLRWTQGPKATPSLATDGLLLDGCCPCCIRAVAHIAQHNHSPAPKLRPCTFLCCRDLSGRRTASCKPRHERRSLEPRGREHRHGTCTCRRDLGHMHRRSLAAAPLTDAQGEAFMAGRRSGTQPHATGTTEALTGAPYRLSEPHDVACAARTGRRSLARHGRRAYVVSTPTPTRWEPSPPAPARRSARAHHGGLALNLDGADEVSAGKVAALPSLAHSTYQPEASCCHCLIVRDAFVSCHNCRHAPSLSYARVLT
jgi:hypothetical protein